MRKKIAFFVSGKNGVESFVERQIYFLSKHFDIYLFFTNIDHRKTSNLINKFIFNQPSLILFIISFLWVLIRSPRNFVSLLSLAVKSKSIIDFILGIQYAKSLNDISINLILSSFSDRKLSVAWYANQLIPKKKSIISFIHAHEIYANPIIDFIKFISPSIDLFIAISELNKTKFQSICPDSNIIVNRLSIDLEFFNKNLFNILIVARYEKRKGYEILFKTLKKLSEYETGWFCTIVGFGDYDIRTLAKNFGIFDSLVIFDKLSQSQLRAIYKGADLFVLPSIHTLEGGSEGIPVAIMEAMAFDIPVITTDNGSINELCTNTIPQNDPDALYFTLIDKIASFKKANIIGDERNKISMLHGTNNDHMLVKLVNKYAR